MSKDVKENLRKLVAEVDEDIFISVKILSLKKRMTVGEYMRDIVEKHVMSKSKVIETAEEL